MIASKVCCWCWQSSLCSSFSAHPPPPFTLRPSLLPHISWLLPPIFRSLYPPPTLPLSILFMSTPSNYLPLPPSSQFGSRLSSYFGCGAGKSKQRQALFDRGRAGAGTAAKGPFWGGAIECVGAWWAVQAVEGGGGGWDSHPHKQK